jgi:hypothetical protein
VFRNARSANAGGASICCEPRSFNHGDDRFGSFGTVPQGPLPCQLSAFSSTGNALNDEDDVTGHKRSSQLLPGAPKTVGEIPIDRQSQRCESHWPRDPGVANGAAALAVFLLFVSQGF